MSGIPLNWANGYRFFSDLHPKRESHYALEKGLAGILPGYGSWMQSRAYDEQMADLRNRLGVSWADIKSPWVASLSGNTRYQTGSSMVSKNLSRLYK